jgi:hypothetical protein
VKPWTLVLFFLLALCVRTASAQPPADRAFSEEVARQNAIYKSVGQQVPEGYEIGRSLLSYSVVLSPEFRLALGELDARHRWLDIGAGEGRAVVDYVTSRYDAMLRTPNSRGEKAQAVAMSIEDRRTVRWHDAAAKLQAQQIQYMFGRRLREYSQPELGQFHLITDVLGGFSYSRLLSSYMERALSLLAVNGTFFTVLQDVSSAHGANRPHYAGASFLTEFKAADGSDIKVCSWLKSITCVEVSCTFTPEASPPIEKYRISKVCDDVRVPATLTTHFEAGTPPERKFLVQGAALERTAAAQGMQR